jgi:hypothetical protein
LLLDKHVPEEHNNTVTMETGVFSVGFARSPCSEDSRLAEGSSEIECVIEGNGVNTEAEESPSVGSVTRKRLLETVTD